MSFKTPNPGLKGKLVLYLLLPCCLVVGTMLYIYNEDLNEILRQKQVEQAILDATGLQAAIESVGLPQDQEELQEVVKEFHSIHPQYHTINMYGSTDQGPRVLASSDPAQIGQAVQEENVATLIEGTPSFREDRSDGKKYLETVVPLFIAGRTAAAIGLYASRDPGDVLISHLRSRLLTVGPIGLSVLLLVLYLGVNRMIVRPMGRLAQHTEAIARGNYHLRITLRGRDEVAKLSQAFNEMCASLEKTTGELSRKNLELESSLSLLHATLESTADGILVVDNAGKMVSFNQKFVTMWHIPRSIVESGDNHQALAFVLDQLKDPEGFLVKVRELYAQPDAESYDLLEFKDGRIFERYSQPQRIGGKSVGRVWSFRDISQRARAERALAEQAIRDSLTNLYNRRYFEHRIEEEIARADRAKQALAILLCDLDHFKAVNDAWGHQTGDEVLKVVARRIQEATRGTDLVFRWGGDEFVVVLADATRDGVLVVADRITKGIHNISERADLSPDLSIGIALYPEHGHTVDELIRLADRALYIAKKGGDRVHIGEEEYRLDEQAVKVVFQPIVDIRTNQILGYEALSRDPQGKLSILELFKRYQAVGQLNELKEICFKSQLKAAGEAGLQRVFVNVDFYLLNKLETLSKPTFMDVVLEISELEALHDIENRLAVSKKWREMGYKFAIDDFGAGFISLPFVSQLIPDYIKLDRSTILQSVAAEKFRTFLRDLVQALQNYVATGIIAEGIETEKELQVVKSAGIHLVQGFLFGKPQEIQ